MEQALPLFSPNSFLNDDAQDPLLQILLDQLRQKKLSWDSFLLKVGNPLSLARLVSTEDEFTLLHLAILDNRIDLIKILNKDPGLVIKRNGFGLSPVEMAELLNRKEALQILLPHTEKIPFPKLPEIENFEYLPHPIFESPEDLEKVLSYNAKAKREDKIPAEKIWMGIYFDKEIRKANHPPISIRHVSKEVGFGVFADKKIPPCTYVGEYTGVIQERKTKQLKNKTHFLRYPIWESKKSFFIDAGQKGNFTRFISHSDKPNVGLEPVYWRGIPRMIFVALKEIKEGGQLTFDYGPLFGKERTQQELVIC